MTGNRRHFFSCVGRGLASTVCQTIETMRGSLALCANESSETLDRPWVRPPGALPSAQFRAACTRCTACQEACPYQSIRRLGPEWDDDSGTPAIIPAESPCYLCADMPCIAACEPRALRPTPPHDVNMGTARLQRDLCYVAQGQPCDYCVTRCPLKGRAIDFADDGIPQIDDARCAGCGVCAFLCPPGALAIVPQHGS